MFFGLESIVCALRRRARGERLLSIEPPWYFVADAAQLMVYACCVVAYLAREPLWLLGAGAAVLVTFAWNWKWGFICFPRRTAAGRRLDARLRR